MLTHKGTKTIITERLILRKFELGDEIQVFNNWTSDEEVTKYLTWNHHTSILETEKILDLCYLEDSEAKVDMNPHQVSGALRYRIRALIRFP